MKSARKFAGLAAAALLAGCAASAPKPEQAENGKSAETVKFQVSDRASQLIAEQGKASASMRGYSRDTDLICDWITKVGSHLKAPVCFTRAEMEEYQEKMRQAVMKIWQGGPCAPPNVSHPGILGQNQPVASPCVSN